ncbi:MAG: hypothetical protein M1834_003346 [Cirrosporium novae-zelandiae]|nr:MAG: hypothetical protein M1834_003346 [Cirrosporium novae-zelandiae]
MAVSPFGTTKVWSAALTLRRKTRIKDPMTEDMEAANIVFDTASPSAAEERFEEFVLDMNKVLGSKGLLQAIRWFMDLKGESDEREFCHV